MNMRTLTTLLCLAAVLELPLAHAANTPMTEYLHLDRTDYAIAAVGGIGAPSTQGGGAGSLHLDGISGTVTLALLYWNGIDIEFPAEGLTGGNGDYDQPQVHFDGGDIIGTRVAAGGSNDCWPSLDSTLPPSAATYRADVTAQVRLRGNGDYTFSGFTSKPGHSANGLSLIVYFDDGNPANDFRIAHYEGSQSNVEIAHFAFDIDYNGGRVEAVLHASDGQGILTDGSLLWSTLPGRPDQGVANTLKYTKLYDGLQLWPGNSVPYLGHQRGGNPDTLWDIRRMPLTLLFASPRHYSTQFDYPKSGQDCVSIHVVQIVQPSDAQAPMLAPSPYDFGDVVGGTTSATQRFTFTNLMPGPVTIQPPAISDSLFHIVAQTCDGQTLAAGATCTIDVTFAPVAVQPAYSRMTVLRVPFKDAVFPLGVTNPVYVELRGSGVPSVPFSRLTFEPRTCTFKPTTVGNTSAPVRFNVRSSGTLPLTLGSVVGGEPRFPLIATTCTNGLTLSSGSACTLDLAFRPSVAGAVSNAARVEYTASDAPANSAMSLPLNGTGIVAGDAIFADGFEQSTCID
ncbi:MAG: choice-of-anchor D domain-containing protein [Dokdonella sp.]